MQSDRSVYYTFKYLPIAAGAFFIFIIVSSYLYPENSTFNGEPGPPDVWTALIFILVGILLIILPFLYLNRLVIVELTQQKIKIKNKKGGEVLEFNWLEVEDIDMLPAIFPPLYKLRLKNFYAEVLEA